MCPPTLPAQRLVRKNQVCNNLARSGGGRARSSPRASQAPLGGLGVPAPSLSAPSQRPRPALSRPRCLQALPSFRPFLQVSSLPQAAPGARQSPIYCLVSTVTRRRRQRLSSAAPTRRRDVCPPLPLCPYLERLCGWGRDGSRTPAAPRPLLGSAPARTCGALICAPLLLPGPCGGGRGLGSPASKGF